MDRIQKLARELAAEIEGLPDTASKVAALNAARAALHEVSPFKGEPVDFVEWIRSDKVAANDYNPNKVASPEMKLLHLSIKADGYTQPVVAFPMNDASIIVDGFHRYSVGTAKKDIADRLDGYLPVTHIRKKPHERIASTIRHNRARGKHQVELMAGLLVRLHNMGRKDNEIARELGMTSDELIRLKAQTGLAALYANQSYSRSWVAADDAS